MKKITSIFKSIPKMPLAIFAVLAAVLVPVAIQAWGPNRDTFTVENPANRVVFNSITNNPVYGDERSFVTIKDAANTTDGGWQKTINVEKGKTYQVRMYVHNNANANLNLKSINTRVMASVPTNTAKSIPISGFVTSDNANPQKVWDDITLNSSQDFNLAYVPGSARLYNNGIGAKTGVQLSDGIVTSAGALIGYNALDGVVPGCFQYDGYVYFNVTPQFAPTNDFTVSKQVRKEGDKTWSESVKVNPGQRVEYQIKYQNTGEVRQNNVVIKDFLPAGVTYVAGSSYVMNGTNPNGIKVSDNVVTPNGINIGDYNAQAAGYVKFTAQVGVNSALPVCGANTLRNVARATVDGGGKEDPADVIVDKECTPENPNFEMNKKVRVAGQTEWKDNVTAKPGDTLEYRIDFKNTGDTTLNNVIVKDTLPAGITYVNGSSKLFNDANASGKAIADGVTTTGVNIGNYAAGKTANVQFQAKVPAADQMQCGENKYHNVASVKPDGQNPEEDDADTIVPKECQPNFEMNKKVRVEGTTEWKDSVTAKPGQTLEYRINFKNTGETELKNVMVKDNLPAGVTYVNGSSKLFNDANPSGVAINDGVTTTGVNIGNYAPGKTAAVEFKAKIADNDNLPKCGENVLKNIAKVDPDDVNPKEDDADTTVPKECEKPVKFECEILTADKNVITRGGSVNFTVTPRSTGENVTVKEFKIDYGDTQTQINDSGKFSHTYPTVGEYTAQAWVTFSVNGKTETVTSESCKKPIKVNEAPVNPCPTNPSIPADDPNCKPCPYNPSLNYDDPNCVPGYIPSTGVDGKGVAGGIIGAGALTLGIASWLNSRRVLRSLK